MSREHEPGREWTDADRAAALAALAANGGNLSRTAKETGVPRKTLALWQKRQSEAGRTSAAGGPGSQPLPPKRGPAATPPLPAEVIERAKGELGDKLEAIAHRLADAIPGKIEAAPLSQCATALGIAIEKMRLLREQSTSTTEAVVRVEFEELRKLDHDELLRRYREALGASGVGRN